MIAKYKPRSIIIFEKKKLITQFTLEMFKMVVWSWKLKVFNSSFVYGAFSRQLPTTNVKVCHFPTVIDAGSFKKISKVWNVWRADSLESWHLKGASHTNKRSQHAYAGSSGFLLSHEFGALLNTHNAFRTCRIWRAGFFLALAENARLENLIPKTLSSK